eukprot:gene26632-biopygen17037
MSRGGCSRPEPSWNRSWRARATLQGTKPDKTMRECPGTSR